MLVRSHALRLLARTLARPLTRPVTLPMALSLGLLGVGCAPAPSSSTTATTTVAELAPVLRLYQVPASTSRDVASMLNNLLYRGDGQPRLGSVGVAPGGQLLVSAPATFHSGVEALVESMGKEKATPPPRLHFDVWLVMGEKSSTPTAGAAVAPDIADVIDTLQQQQGAMALELLEHTQLQMTSGSHANTDGLELSLDSQVTLSGDGVIADLELRRRSGAAGRMHVQTVLPLDQTVVLGQVGAISSRALDQHAAAGTAYYIVRARRAS